jgi:hypothetical protein
MERMARELQLVVAAARRVRALPPSAEVGPVRGKALVQVEALVRDPVVVQLRALVQDPVRALALAPVGRAELRVRRCQLRARAGAVVRVGARRR